MTLKPREHTHPHWDREFSHIFYNSVGHCAVWWVHHHAVWCVGHHAVWCMDQHVVWCVDLCIWNSVSESLSGPTWVLFSPTPHVFLWGFTTSYFGCCLIYPTAWAGVTWEWVLLSRHHWIPVWKPKGHFAYSRYSININWTKLDLISLWRFNMLCMMNNSVLSSELLSLVKAWIRHQEPH